MLRLEELADELRVFLIHRNDPRALRIRGAVVGHVAIELLHANAHERHAPQQLDRRDGIVLVLRNDVRVRRARSELLNRVARRLIAIVQQLRLELRGVVERREIRDDHVVHRVAKPPFALGPRAGVERRRTQLACSRAEDLSTVVVRGVAQLPPCVSVHHALMFWYIGM